MTSLSYGFRQKSDENSAIICPVGFDNGHGNPKAVIDGAPVIFPAYICPDFQTDLVDEFPGLVEIDGRKFLTGEQAEFTPGMVRTADNESRKAEYALPMLLGAIARLPYRPQWNLKVVASAQSAEVRSQLPDRLNGEHEVILNNCDRVLVKVQVLATVPEGATISAFYPGATGVIDIGFGDLQGLIVQQFRVLSSNRYRGLDWVVNRIYAELKAQGKGADMVAIRSGIDNQTFRTAGLDPIDFRDRYNAAINAWFSSQLEPVLRSLKDNSSLQKVVVIGGGINNKQIREYLSQYQLAIPESPEMLSANALYQVARAKANGTK